MYSSRQRGSHLDLRLILGLMQVDSVHETKQMGDLTRTPVKGMSWTSTEIGTPPPFVHSSGARMTRWAVGERWPDEWGRKPTFPRCDGGNCKIIEAWDEEGMHEDFGYPANETIPDLYGHLIDGRWLLCEFKSSSIRNGVTQLEKGTRQMRGLCHPVSALGIVIDGFKRHDKWFCCIIGR